MYAVDEGVPPKRSSPKVVTIRVIRNKNDPQFVGEPYTKEIDQNARSGTGVFNVRADDRDARVSLLLPVL